MGRAIDSSRTKSRISLTGAFVIVLGIVAGAAQELPRLVIEYPAAPPLDAANVEAVRPDVRCSRE
jgi:hypothetical protein